MSDTPNIEVTKEGGYTYVKVAVNRNTRGTLDGLLRYYGRFGLEVIEKDLKEGQVYYCRQWEKKA